MYRKARIITAAALVLLAAVPVSCPADQQELKILGWVEYARLPELDLEVKAKLDTGAETSSLDARIIKKFRQDGKRWVRFAVYDPADGEEHVIVRERVRTIAVVQHDGSRQTRPVVEMTVCFAGLRMVTELSLIDRSEFIYPLLLGRSALASVALVDPGSTFLSEPGCRDEPSQVESKEPQPPSAASAGNGASAILPRAKKRSWNAVARGSREARLLS